MDREIPAQHIASFLEHDEELKSTEIMYNLEAVASQPDRTLLDCNLRIVDGEYLTVRVQGERDPSECFDLCFIDDVHGYSWARKGTEYPQLFVFRFLARDITDGEAPNEVHIFSLDTTSQLKWVIDAVNNAVENARRQQKPTKPRHPPTRTVSKKKNSVKKLEKIKRAPKEIASVGTKSQLEELNRLLDEIEAFESALHDAVSFQVTGATQIDRSIWRDSLSPPSHDAAVAHVERIRSSINFTTDLRDNIVDPGPGDLLNRLFESLWWVQKICDGNRVLHYDPNLVRAVWRPAFSDRVITTLKEYLQAGNKSFWQSLGNAWTTSGGKPDDFTSDFPASTGAATADRNGFKPEMTIKDYGYYKPANVFKALETPKMENIDMESFINGVRARGGSIVIATQKNVSEAARELSINVGDILEVLDESGEWFCLRTPTGQTGHVPRKCIEILEDSNGGTGGPSKMRPPSRSRSKSPRVAEKKRSFATKHNSTAASTLKFRDSQLTETDTTDDDCDGKGDCDCHCRQRSSRAVGDCDGHCHQRSSRAVQMEKHQSCGSCWGSQHHSPQNGNRQSMSPNQQMQLGNSLQYQPMNTHPLQQRQCGQPIIHNGANGQPSVIVVPSAPAQASAPKPPPIHYLVSQPPPPPPAPPAQPLIVPMPYPMQQPMMQPQMMQPQMMQQPMMQQPIMQPFGMYGGHTSPAMMDPYYDRGYHGYESVRRQRRRSQSPRRSNRNKHHRSNRHRKSSSSSSNSSSSSSSSSRSRRSASNKRKHSKHNGSKSAMDSVPQPTPIPQPPKEETYDVINQTVRKQRLLSQMTGHKPPPHMETMNRELQERMKSMREGNSNGLKPTDRRKINDSWNASQLSNASRLNQDPAAEIERLATKFGAAQAT